MKKWMLCLLAMLLALGLYSAAAEEYTWPSENGLYGLADENGQIVLPCIYDQQPIVIEEIGCIYVLQDGFWGLLALDGEEIIAPEWDALYSLNDERTLWAAFRGDMVMNPLKGWEEPGTGLWALYSADGTELSPLQWSKIERLTDGLMLVEKDGLMGALNAQGEIVIPAEWTWINQPQNGVLTAQRAAIWCAMDTTGAVIIPLTECDHIFANSDGTIRMVQWTDVGDTQDWRESVFDLNGNEITPCIWVCVEDFSEGLAAVLSEDAWGYINLQGEQVIPCEWDEANEFSGSYAIVCKDGLYGVIDTNGKMVIPCEWDALESLGNGKFEGTKTCVIDAADSMPAD